MQANKRCERLLRWADAVTLEARGNFFSTVSELTPQKHCMFTRLKHYTLALQHYIFVWPPHRLPNAHIQQEQEVAPAAVRASDSDARWLFTFLISQLHCALLIVISVCCPGGVMSVLTPLMTPSASSPFSHQLGPLCHCLPACFFFFPPTEVVAAWACRWPAMTECCSVQEQRYSYVLTTVPDPLLLVHFNMSNPPIQSPYNIVVKKKRTGGKVQAT